MSKYIKKVRNLFLDKGMRHHRNLHPFFSLGNIDSCGGREVLWCGRAVGYAQGVERFKNSQSGKCYIIANGPSVSDLDVNDIDGACYGVNGTIVKFRDTSKKLSHYEISDPSFFEKRFELVEEVLDYGTPCHFTFDALNRICEKDPSVLKDKEIILYPLVNTFYGQKTLDINSLCDQFINQGFSYLPEHFDPYVGFNLNISGGVFGGRTVAFQAVQNAVYLGYDKVFLVGMDLGGQEKMRFYEDNANGKPRKSRLDKDYEPYIEPAFKCAAQAVADGHFDLYNLSETSRLPSSIVKKISLDDAISL